MADGLRVQSQVVGRPLSVPAAGVNRGHDEAVGGAADGFTRSDDERRWSNHLGSHTGSVLTFGVRNLGIFSQGNPVTVRVENSAGAAGLPQAAEALVSRRLRLEALRQVPQALSLGGG